MQSPHPLSWPAGWPRTENWQRRSAAFREDKRLVSNRSATRRLQEQLNMLDVDDAVLSTNLRRNLDGSLKSNEGEPTDCGVAVYFELDGQPTSLACDKWDRVADNICALAKHIEALRGMDRWGVGSVKQAFAGYQALPAPEQWFEVLGVPSTATIDQINTAYRKLAKAAHSDHGGSDAAMARLNTARDQGRAANG